MKPSWLLSFVDNNHTLNAGSHSCSHLTASRCAKHDEWIVSCKVSLASGGLGCCLWTAHCHFAHWVALTIWQHAVSIEQPLPDGEDVYCYIGTGLARHRSMLELHGLVCLLGLHKSSRSMTCCRNAGLMIGRRSSCGLCREDYRAEL